MPRLPIMIAALWLTFGTQVSAAGAGLGEQLIEATQQQQVKAVRKLLGAGADVDFKTRYGATALFFACDKGNVELVELLLEHGAEVNVTDTFYAATPLTWTLSSVAESPAHRRIALRLLGAGAADAPAALEVGVRLGDRGLVEAAVEGGQVAPAAIFAARERAEAAGEAEIAAYLRAQASAMPEVALAPDKLAGSAGDDQREAASGAAIAGGGAGDQDTDRVEMTPASAEPLPEVPRGKALPWPRFRGAGAAGIGDGQGAPASWDGASGRGVLWQTRIPGLAHSSPVIWGDKIFLTTAITVRGDQSLRTGLYGDVSSVDDKSRHVWQVLCLDRTTGKVLWQRTARRGRPQAKRHLKSTQANPTPVTDGRHLVAHFGPQGIFCYDLDGRRQWRKKKLGTLSSGWFYDATYEWGFSSSPIIHDGKVISQVDVQHGSYIAAFDLATGRVVWRTERDEIPTWGTPVVLENGIVGAEIVTNGTIIRGYDAGSGEELWRLAPNSEITVASPVVAGGVAYVTGGYRPVQPIYAVRPGGRGDLTLPAGQTASDHVAWSSARGGAYIPSPIVYRGRLYVLHNDGRLSARDAATGELVYRARVGGAASFSSSPVAADGRLYFTSEEGTTFVVRAGDAYEVLETNLLGEVVMSTPAISGGLLVIRGAQHVWGLGAEAASAVVPPLR